MAAAEIEAAYRGAAARLAGAGMPGLECGLLPLALLAAGNVQADANLDWGPYEPWIKPLALLAQDRRAEAAVALQKTPEPPRDLLYEVLWCLTARAAIALDDRDAMKRAHQELSLTTGQPGSRERANRLVVLFVDGLRHGAGPRPLSKTPRTRVRRTGELRV